MDGPDLLNTSEVLAIRDSLAESSYMRLAMFTFLDLLRVVPFRDLSSCASVGAVEKAIEGIRNGVYCRIIADSFGTITPSEEFAYTETQYCSKTPRHS